MIIIFYLLIVNGLLYEYGLKEENTMDKVKYYLPGVTLAFLIAVPAWIAGNRFPVIGSPILGILFGMLLSFWSRSEKFDGGIRFTSKKLLQYSIILLGFQMNLFQIFKVGRQTLFLMIFTLAAAFVTAYAAGKLLKMNGNTKILVGVGTAICGGSAIAAAAPVIQATDEEVVHSVSTIFLFNVAAAFLFPFIGHLAGMSDHTFGLWAGTAINDTSSVVAAGYSFSNDAGNLAVIVKLTRTLAIVPVTLALAFRTARVNKNQGNHFNMSKVFPWFVLGFLGASVCSTFLPLVAGYGSVLSGIGKFMIVMAMASIGLNTNVARLIKNGGKPILLGFVCWVVLAATSLIAQQIV